MPWMWWGVGCKSDRGTHQPIERWDEITEQILVHSFGVANRDALMKEAGLSSLDVVGNAVGLLGLVGLAFPPISLATTVGVAAKFAWDKRENLKRLRGLVDESKKSSRSLDAASSREEEDEQFARFLEKWSQRVPLIIVLDDVHWASERLLGIINRLVQSNDSRVLVIATSWPHALSTNTSLEVHDHVFQQRWQDWTSRIPDRIFRIDIEPMSPDSCGELLDQTFPDLDRAIREGMIRQADHNPLVLRMIMFLQSEALREGTFLLSDIERLPRNVDDAFRAMWEEFPTDVRKFLSLAAYLGNEYLVELLGPWRTRAPR